MGQRYRDEYGNVWEVVDESGYTLTLRDVVTGDVEEVSREELHDWYTKLPSRGFDW